jgi:PAS domain S-box-containing protein
MDDRNALPAAPDPHVEAPAFLAGGGEMGALMRGHDWAASPLGPPAAWPQTLRTMVRVLLNTGHPMYIWWGPERACLYNDAYRQSIGPERHPQSLGRPAREVWAEIWDIIDPQIEQVMSGGGATWHVNQLVPITRNGRREDVYWTYSYSPIDDEQAPCGVGGVLVVCTETTANVQLATQLRSERDRLSQLFEQSPTFMAMFEGPQHRFVAVNPAYRRLVGDRELLGKTVAQALPEVVGQGYVDLLDRVFATGEPYIATEAPYMTPAAAGSPSPERYVDFVYQPIRQEDGRISGIFVSGADVTERALAFASVRRSESQFRVALNAGRMGSWETDYTTNVRRWSAEGMALFGLSLPGGIGHVGGADDEYIAAIHPEDRETARHYREIAQTQDSFPAAYRVVRPDGKVLWLAGRGLVTERGPQGEARRLVSIMADTTEQRAADERLRVERARLGLAMSAGQMGAYELDIVEDRLWWSPETYALFGVTPETFVPTRDSVAALIHPDDRDEFVRSRAEAIARRRPFVHEFRTLRPDGTEAWLSHRGQAEYDEFDRPVRNFGITMDITERRKVEQFLRDADRRKDNFIATLAHELRNPLAPIRSAAHALHQVTVPDPRLAWCRDVIERQVAHMTRLLDDLLDLSRLNRGELRLRREVVNLAEALEHAQEIAQPLVLAGGHRLSVELADRGLAIEGDMTRMAQIFSNLLINAVKYTPGAGQIEVRLARDGDAAVVSVSDSGVGIAPENHERIFEMFGQLQAEGGNQGGQGIGLALTKALVEMHGGGISVRSPGLGLGSTFSVRLPLPADAAQRPAPAAPTTLRSDGEHRLRVLIADDSTDIADTIALLLEDLGHETRVAYDGEQALAMAAEWSPDVALLDLGMPKLNGYELCRRIRQLPGGPGMTLIAQTGWGQEEQRRRTTEAGFDHHVVKPADIDDVVALFPRAGR